MKKSDEPSLHVSYVPRLLTKKKQKLISQYLQRFYTPYTILVWCFVALDANDCNHMRFWIPAIAIFSSGHSTYRKYTEFYKDLVYILENNDFEVDEFMKMHYILFEFMIQFVATLTTFYWIDEVHTCLKIDRNYQSYLFFFIMALTFFSHVTFYLNTKKQTEHFVRATYSHINSNVV